MQNRNFKFLVLILPFAFYLLAFSGCATAPTGTGIAYYNLKGITYVPLVSLCNINGINLEYDTFTRSAILSKSSHRINLMVGDSTVLVDGAVFHLRHPVDIYAGTVVVPSKFKEQILDPLFKAYGVSAPSGYAITSIKKIVVDAGHGGTDPGAIGRTGLREKTVTLDVALRLAKLLKAQGVEVVLTRSSDRFVSLPSRVKIANSSKADLFLSVHANANRVRSLRGFEIYYISPKANDSRRALNCASNASLDLGNVYYGRPSLNLRATLWDMIQTYNRAESVELSRTICKTVDNNLDARILGIKGAKFYVLDGARMPAVLAEVGFLSNSSEECLLKNSYYRQKIAETLAEGVINYGRNYKVAQN